MPTPQKEQSVEFIKGKLKDSPAVYIVNYQGTDVEKLTALRKDFRENGSEMIVVKNTLTTIAAKAIGFEGMADYLSGPTALVFCESDIVAPAKVLEEFTKKNKKFKIKGGLVEGQVIDDSGVKRMASIPPREVLLSQLLGVLIGPVTGFVRVLNGVPRGCVTALDAIVKKKEET